MHALFDAGKVLFVFEVALLDVVELLLAGLVGLECVFIEEIPELFRFLEDVECHFEGGVLELDDEVDEQLVLVLPNREFPSNLPELLRHPVGDNRDVLQVVHKPANVAHLLREAARQP